MTPLHWAAYHGDKQLVQYLCYFGARESASVHGYFPVDLAGFCGKSEAVEYLANNLCETILKQEKMIQNGEFEVREWDGEIVFHQEPVNYHLSKKEIEAFNLILEKGSRIHAYFAMDKEDKLNPEKVAEDKDYSST